MEHAINTNQNTAKYDFAIIGGGIVGMATAYRLAQRHPNARLVVLEKESAVGLHQTGRNSGVLHSGIYYQPGSMKAKTCREGKLSMEAFCSEHSIAWNQCGKLIVAIDETEVPALDRIFQRGLANGVVCRKVDRLEMREIEPHAAGVAAIHVRETGIVDYVAVTNQLKKILHDRHQAVRLNTTFLKASVAKNEVQIETSSGLIQAGYLINCGGLYCDKIMQRCGSKPPVKIVPFRGEYYLIRPNAWGLCRGLIYPVPDPSFPFLGVHFTRMIDGGLECGPNAVLALGREAYDWKSIHVSETLATLCNPGFLRLAGKYWRTGASEVYRSLSKAAFVTALQRLVPDITAADLTPAPAGIRAQAVTADGKLVDDFLIVHQERMTHVLNAPSPAATASLEIGNAIVQSLPQGM